MSSLIRHITPVAPDRADGVLAEVYAQVDAEFSSIGPAVMMMSPAPQLMAAGWSLMREAQLAGDVPPVDRTVVALGAARANGLAYDVEAYLSVLRLLGEAELADAVARWERPADDRLAALLSWASSTGVAGGEPEPFPGGPVAEHVGTLLFTHFVNRVAAAMLPPGLTPGTMDPGDEPAFEGAPVLHGLRRALPPGTTLPLLEGLPAGKEPAWAAGLPIGTAYAALTATAAQGAGLLSPAASKTAERVLADHRGRRLTADASSDDTPPGGPLDDALQGLPVAERAGARLAILAGLAPETITDAEVAAWRATDRRLSDHCTVHLLAYGAMTAVTHIESDLTL
ncbi:DNA-binding protein [Nonomuraea terrae]|uniref:DNA-binding protein n=1 Tax=Nonomuraea terrae TaxID=2530383 RepID=A0A4R4YSY6_9ACTN|nr:DNA-binding protein [Nonomuraea terrae]TDD47514.1 DNA-binding protein [Nonomuraea terrae]